VYHRDGTGEHTQVPDNSWSPETDGMYPHCASDGVIQALSDAPDVRQTGCAVDTETAVHRVHRYVQLPC